jgi:hypothetical protein
MPDPSAMQVRAKINESRITKVREGLPALVRIDALPDSKLQAVVTRVDKYAVPGGFGSSPVKQYYTFVKILDPPPIIRSGMTAEVSIYVEQRPKALQVQVQAVCEHKGKIFCLVQTGENKYETREVKIGSSNDKMVTIESDNVKEGDQLVLNPRAHKALLVLPDLPDIEQVQVVAMPPPAGDATGEAGPSGEGPRGGERGRSGGGNIMSRDANGDGKLSADELAEVPEEFRARLMQADANGDGELDAGEISAMPRRGGGGAAGGGEPPAGVSGGSE